MQAPMQFWSCSFLLFFPPSSLRALFACRSSVLLLDMFALCACTTSVFIPRSGPALSACSPAIVPLHFFECCPPAVLQTAPSPTAPAAPASLCPAGTPDWGSPEWPWRCRAGGQGGQQRSPRPAAPVAPAKWSPAGWPGCCCRGWRGCSLRGGPPPRTCSKILISL